MFRNNSDTDWERFGAEDPYYSILNTEAYRRHHLDDEAILEIFQSGENTIQTFLGFAEERFGLVSKRSALEFGCGVGRLLIPLSGRFGSVTGVDVSPSMLGEAEHHCRRVRAANVQLHLSDDQLSRVQSSFDFVISFLVLQHIPVKRGETVIRELVRRLNPGGIAALHFTTSRSSSRFRHVIHILRRNSLPLHWLGNLLSGMRWNEPLMQTNLYRLDRIMDIAHAEGISETDTQPIQYGDHVGVMLYLCRGDR